MNRKQLQHGTDYAVALGPFASKISIGTPGLIRATVISIDPLRVRIVTDRPDKEYGKLTLRAGDEKQLTTAARIAARWDDYETFHREMSEAAEQRAALKADRNARMDRIVALLTVNGFVPADRLYGLYREDVDVGGDYYRHGDTNWEGPDKIMLTFTVDALERLIHGETLELTAGAKEVTA